MNFVVAVLAVVVDVVFAFDLYLLAAKGIRYECLKAGEKFSFIEKPYLLAYLFLISLRDLLSGKNKLTAGKDRRFILFSNLNLAR